MFPPYGLVSHDPLDSTLWTSPAPVTLPPGPWATSEILGKNLTPCRCGVWWEACLARILFHTQYVPGPCRVVQTPKMNSTCSHVCVNSSSGGGDHGYKAIGISVLREVATRKGSWNPAGLLGGAVACGELVGPGDLTALFVLPFAIQFVCCFP